MNPVRPPTTLLAFEEERPFAQALAAAARMRLLMVERHRFPDGELKLTLPPLADDQVALLRTLHEPNEKLVELLLASHAARALGVRRLTLVAPYLAYMRQDAAFVAGEAISQRIVGGLLAQLFDVVVTIDPHLHRISNLLEAVPVTHALVLSAAPALGRLIAERCPGAIVIGPDEESEQWARVAADCGAGAWAVCRKDRRGDRDVSIRLPDIDLRGRHVVLVDDVASTGRTLAHAAAALRAAGAARVDAAVTHPVFAADALAVMSAHGIAQVWSSDTIPHPTNAVSVVPLIAAAISAPN